MNPSSSSSRPNSNPDSGSGQQQYKPLAMVVSEVMPQTADVESWTSQKTSKKKANQRKSLAKRKINWWIAHLIKVFTLPT